MIQELLVSFKDNIKQKTTNPFFGTLIIVWIIHNWVFVYTLFNFDEKILLSNRIALLEKYLEPKYFSISLLWCILTTFIVLFMSYVFLNASRFIVNYFEKTVTPFVYKITDKSSIILKSEYNSLIKEKEKYELKYENEKESKQKLQDEIEKLENKIRELTTNKVGESVISSEETTHKDKKAILENLEKLDYLNDFDKLIENITNKRAVKINEPINYFLKIGLITKGRWYSDSGTYSVDFTKNGEDIKDYFVREYLLKK